MGKFSDALAASTARIGNPPKMQLVLDAMTATERGDLEAALDDPAIPSAQIARALQALDHDVSADNVRQWRAGTTKAARG